MTMDIQAKLKEYSALVEASLKDCLPPENIPQGLISQAMSYSVMAGGKRLRPALTLEFCRVCGGDIAQALPFACAVEMVHTYSLIHDDLPCMDNDDYRRGRLTNHKVYGEAMATLAGDGLLTHAFAVIADKCDDPETAVRAISVLANAAGVSGMLGGQVLDLEGETRPYNEDEIRLTHNLKTGALFSAACQMGCLAAGASGVQLVAAQRYARAMGYAFQLRDDLLDVIGDAALLGKATGHDEQKQTIVSLKGTDYCLELIAQQTAKAEAALDEGGFDDTDFLRELTQYLATREK